MRKPNKRKKKGKYSKILVAFLIASNVIVLAVAFWILDRSGVEAAALAGLWFGWSTVELAYLKDIKTTKEKTQARKEIEKMKYNDEFESEEN